jgi:hypothetical protein
MNSYPTAQYKVGDTIPNFGVVTGRLRMKSSWRYNCYDENRGKTIFEEYDENVVLAIRLQEFMRFTYIPKGWVVTISNVDFVPHILAEDIDFLKSFPDITSADLSTYRHGVFNKWYIKEAIKEFFKTKS